MALHRFKMYRGKRPPDDPLPEGVRRDTRFSTRHCLRPEKELVTRYLEQPTAPAWAKFEKEYAALLDSRFRDDRTPFDELAAQALEENVFIGCSCPTQKNPDVNHCHTVLALRFMQARYPDLDVVFPQAPSTRTAPRRCAR